MTNLYLKFDPDRVTFDQMITMQETAGATLREQKAMLLAFVVDADGQPVDPEQANTLLGQLTLTQIRETFTAFSEQVKEAMDGALPNEPGPKSVPA